MPKLALTLAVLVSLVVTASATADLGRSTDMEVTANPLVQQYLGIAARFFGVPVAELVTRNHCQSYTVEVGPTEATAPEGMTVAAEAPVDGCWYRFAPFLWAKITSENREEAAEGRRFGCIFSAHEYGHSVGFGDQTTNPLSITFIEPSSNMVPECTSDFPYSIIETPQWMTGRCQALAIERKITGESEAECKAYERKHSAKRSKTHRHNTDPHRVAVHQKSKSYSSR